MAIGPVLGGVFGGVLGFRSIFWLLVILSALAIFTIAFFLPETLRCIAGNGSVRLTDVRYQPLCERLWPTDAPPSYLTATSPLASRPRITWRVFFEPLLFLLEKDVACTLFFGGVIYTVWSMVTSSTTVLLVHLYGLTTLQVGLCFLPNGIGCIIGSTMAGRQLDSDFKAAEDSYRYRHGLQATYALPKHQLPRDFPLERARLAQLPTMVPVFVFAVLVYGFAFVPSTSLALPLIAQFVIGYSSTAVLNLNNTLTVDLYPGKGASATAVNNLARCLLGAVGVSLTEVALRKTSAQILFPILAGITVVSALSAAAEWTLGMKWRTQRMDRMDREEGRRTANGKA